MMLWLILAVITLMVMALLLLPLLREPAFASKRVDYDVVVYRDQLAEVDKDIERGLLTTEQAETARAEIYRRMLQAEDAEIEGKLVMPQNVSSLRSRWILALIIILIVPFGSIIMYGLLGSPELHGKPYAERKNDPDFAMATEAEKIATQLENKPDAEGYKHLADTYFMIRRYDQAVEAYRKSIAMNGGDAAIWSEFGEAVTMAHDGLVVPQAHAAFTKTLQLDSHDARARFYLGLSETQINEPRRAVAIWKDLEKDGPSDAPWLNMVKEHIAAFSKEGGFDPASVPPAPPSMKSPHDAAMQMPEDVTTSIAPPNVDADKAAAVMAMQPDDQQAMIHTMVNRLAEKMKADPNNREGWQRLAKAYRVLGDTDKAKEAEAKAAALQAQ